jgi:Ca2+-binding RTX toxin-like protein
MRRNVLLLVSTVLAVLLASGVAYAAVIKGTPGDDESLDGTPRSDTIYGYAGADGLRGYGAGDTLDGGRGGDLIRGMAGGDLLLAGGGRDTIFGQRGADRANGGSGSDTIRVDQPKRDEADSVECGYGYDNVFANRKDRVSKNCENVTIQ